MSHISRTHDIEKIGGRVRRARKKARLSQVELATMVGYSAANPISKLESGHVSSLDVLLLQEIARATGVTLGWLMGDVGAAQKEPDTGQGASGDELEPPERNRDEVAQAVQRLSALVAELTTRVAQFESIVDRCWGQDLQTEAPGEAPGAE